MNRLLLLGIAGLIFFHITSCKKDEASSVSEKQNIGQIENGSWKITLFNDSGKDQMYHFTDYSFSFSGGVVTATGRNSSISGSYSILEGSSATKLIMSFGASKPFDNLNDDWRVLESIPDRIRLEDVSGGNGGTDFLTFEKL